MARCEAGEVPCGPIYSIAEIFADPQYQARENMQTVEHQRIGALLTPTSLPRRPRRRPAFAHLGAPLAAHNDSGRRA